MQPAIRYLYDYLGSVVDLFGQGIYGWEAGLSFSAPSSRVLDLFSVLDPFHYAAFRLTFR
jgi:hypothetical protein